MALITHPTLAEIYPKSTYAVAFLLPSSSAASTKSRVPDDRANISIGDRQYVSPTFHDHPTERDTLLSDGGYPVAPCDSWTPSTPDPRRLCIDQQRSHPSCPLNEPTTPLQGARSQTRPSSTFHPASGEIYKDSNHRPSAMGPQSHQIFPGKSGARND
jgi:hypothetical protein